MNEGKQPYKKLLTYRYAYLVFHLNELFMSRYLGDYKNKRNKEQMDQAARSQKQNIAEGASQGTSLKGYIKLTGVARGSGEELLEDYKDFAMKNKIPIWDWKEERCKRFRRYRYFLPFEPHTPLPPIPPLPQNKELVTNLMIDLITRTGYLLDQQRRSLEKKHEEEGGFTEKLYRKRIEYRKKEAVLIRLPNRK